MALNIKKPETEALAQEIVAATGESLTEAVTVALRERLHALRGRQMRQRLHADVAELQAFVASLADRDARSAEALIGYDSTGLPG